ncbi:hypothetical protein AVEN_122670-1 [Araneus ventricosus]|uniref:Uncharacterized protein n=1 Tax=Araneus ventricosus TaxID=182803 RepID=A0A4Y1ZQZ1_ARAVE|nr:hypothetical protein AVEN_122670-1 [Araneus ventricosus]
MAVITRCSIAGSTEVQAACRRATSPFVLSLRLDTPVPWILEHWILHRWIFFLWGLKAYGLSCSSACCLYFGGPRDAATCDDSHSTACSSLPRHARRTI